MNTTTVKNRIICGYYKCGSTDFFRCKLVQIMSRTYCGSNRPNKVFSLLSQIEFVRSRVSWFQVT